MKILLIEDDLIIVQSIKHGLELEHFTVDMAHDGEAGLAKAVSEAYDIIVLDIVLPKKSGVEVCSELREQKIPTPVIMLTARDTINDRIRGLDAGADDYMVKPFVFDELLARIRALKRRNNTLKAVIFRVGDLTLNPANFEVRRGDREIRLTNTEYKILDYMMRRPEIVCTRTMLAEHVWGYNKQAMNNPNLINTYIGYLRKKVDSGHDNQLIHTVFNQGYKIKNKVK